jgi:hypothetical protein
MDTPTTKDYIDAKIEAAHERMSGELKAHQTAINARFDALELTIAFEMKSVRDAVDLKFARNEAQLQKIASDIAKSQSEIIKWVVGAMLASSALTISTVSYIVSQSQTKNNAPIVIYAQPAPPAPPKTQP